MIKKNRFWVVYIIIKDNKASNAYIAHHLKFKLGKFEFSQFLFIHYQKLHEYRQNHTKSNLVVIYL